MKEQDKIKELFAEKLGNFEAPVNPALWKGVASQIGASSATVTTGVSMMTKVLVGIAATAVVGLTTYFIVANKSEETSTPKEQKTAKVDSLDLSDSQENSVLESDNKKNTAESVVIAPVFNHNFISHSEEELTVENVVVESSFSSTNIPMETIPKPVDGETKLPEAPNKVKVKQKQAETDTSTENKTSESGNSVTPQPAKVLASIDRVPNVFTPNGDGVNDVYFIEFSGDLYDFSVVIMDSKNQTIYSSSNPNFKWDGTMMNGETALKGRYLCFVSAKDAEGNRISKSQMLTIE